MKEGLVYILSPVRQATDEQKKIIGKHAEDLKKFGFTVFNPKEDAPQEDATGYNIVMKELEFMDRIAKEGGRVDILWNVGGTPSEGSRVDLGIALALGLKINLVAEFNKETPTGPQLAYRIIKNVDNGVPETSKILQEMEKDGEAVIDWDIDMLWEDQEWQRIRLGLALGCLARNPNFKIKIGALFGIDPPGKGYPKVIKEIEKRQ